MKKYILLATFGAGIIFAIALGALYSPQANAHAPWADTQKIGYTNLELILSLMPEYKQIQSDLETFQKKLLEQLQIKQQYAQSKLEEYQQLRNEGKLTPEQEKQFQQDLLKLEQEIQNFAKDSEEKLLKRRNEKLMPLLEKVQKAVNSVAKENGYAYIFNSTNSSGVSNLLYAPDEHNVTEKVLKKLGITLPKENATNGNK